jgi:hypothetical protein
METWYYRRDRVMKGLPFAELRYEFISKTGYGTAVLQKDALQFNALKQAAKLLQTQNRG